jgi:outer membrane protein TolC
LFLHIRTRSLATACLAATIAAWGALSACAQVTNSQPESITTRAQARVLSLREAIETALLNNRALQIERFNPAIARLSLSASYGYYDPLFSSQFQRETAADTGGFDPADFSRDAIYEAESEIGALGLSGVLPSGLTYSMGGTYAHSDGTRNFLNFDSYKLGASIALRQPLLKNFWTDIGRTAIAVNKKNLKITELGVAFVAMNTIDLVQQGYYELLFARENMRIQQDLLEAKNRTLTGVRRQVELGQLTVLEERLAISQAARVDADLIAATNQVVLAENNLKTLLGYGIEDWEGGPFLPADGLVVSPVPMVLRESWERGLQRRPDLAQLREDYERNMIELRFRRNQLFPSLDVIGAYGRRGASAVQVLPPTPGQPFTSASASLSDAFEQLEDAAAPSDMVGVVFSIPLSRKAERANYRATKEMRDQAAVRVRQKEELVLREISDAYEIAESAYMRVGATQRAREYARLALDAEQQKLASGKSSLFVVLQLQGDLAQVEAAEMRARADHNRAISRLHFAEGSLLEVSGFELDFN